MSEPAPSPEPACISPWQLYLAFSQMSLMGFGGVLPMAYRTLVERRRWLNATDFAALVAFGQVLPGPVICNVGTMFGKRHAGIPGAMAAVLGLVMWPVLCLLACGLAYRHFGDLMLVRHALGGMAAVAAGLMLATALKLSSNLPRRWGVVAWTTVVFAAVGILRWPLLAVLVVVSPVSVWFSWKAPH